MDRVAHLMKRSMARHLVWGVPLLVLGGMLVFLSTDAATLTDDTFYEKWKLELGSALISYFGFMLIFGQRVDAWSSPQKNNMPLELLIQHSPSAFAIFDREMCYLAASASWREEFSLGGREIIGCSNYDIFPELPERWKQIYQQALAGETMRADEDRFERANGEVQCHKWEVCPWYWANGDVGGIIIFVENVSERVQMRREAKERINELGQLHQQQVAAETAAAFVREVSQPLASITQYNEAAMMLLERENADIEKVRNIVAQSAMQAIRAGGMLRQLLDILKLQPYDTGPFAFDEEIGTVVVISQENHGLPFNIELELEPELPQVYASRSHVRQALLNLVSNAIEAVMGTSTSMPRIVVSNRARAHERLVEVAIWDNGSGIAQQDIERIFTPFFTTKKRGIGMGLSVGRSLIEANGGQLWFDSNAHSGTTFRLTLPLAS